MINAFTIDVEDYFQVSAFENVIERSDWERLPGRVENNTQCVMELLAARDVRATFFVLGWIAQRNPMLIRDIVAQGHELASHGLDHTRLTRMSRAEVRDDVNKAKEILEDISGVQVRGYRAPTFSIVEDNLWVHQVLREVGYEYSSSIYPIAHDIYGYPEAPRTPFVEPESGLLEIPIPTLHFFARNWPAGGGGYFRLLPYGLSRWAIKHLNRSEDMACVFYTHPWEFDPEAATPARVAGEGCVQALSQLAQDEAKDRSVTAGLRVGPRRPSISRRGRARRQRSYGHATGSLEHMKQCRSTS